MGSAVGSGVGRLVGKLVAPSSVGASVLGLLVTGAELGR